MTCGDLIDSVVQQLQDPVTRRVPRDRILLLDWLGQEVSELASAYQIDSLASVLEPVTLEPGRARYPLPDDFPENFLRGGDDDGESFLCKLDDASVESQLDYLTPSRFFSEYKTGAGTVSSNGRPNDYTIITQKGAKEIFLGPPPDDSNSYILTGVYIPTRFVFDEFSSPAALQSHPQVLKYGLLRRAQPGNQLWIQEYERSKAILAVNSALGRRSRLVAGLEEP